MSRRLGYSLTLLLFVPILWVGFWLRTYELDQYPPGISNDEAINVVDALHIARTGNFPMYEEGARRVEPLFRIVEAVSLLGFGRQVWSMRFTSALIGLLTIASVIWLSREVCHDMRGMRRVWVMACAGIVIATLIGHVTLSRALFRGILQLLTMTLSMSFLLRGLRRNRWLDYGLSGLFGGLSLYTYTGAWFFPPSFIVLFLALLIFDRGQWRQWLPKLIGLGVLACVICLPILIVIVINPQEVFGRAGDLTSGTTDWWQQISIMIRQFFRVGDENPQYNVALLPIIAPVFEGLFYLGLLALILRIRDARSWFIVSLLLLLSLPALLSNEITHGLRIAGEFVIVPVIIALGLALILQGIDKVLRERSGIVNSLVAVGLVGLLGWQSWEGWRYYQAYFDHADEWQLWQVHGQVLDHNEWFFRTDRRDFVAALGTLDMPILIPVEELNRQTSRSWLMTGYPQVIGIEDDFTLPNEMLLVMPWSLEQGDILRESRDFALLDEGVIRLLPPLSRTAHQALLFDIEASETIERAGEIDFLGYVRPVERADIAFEVAQSRENEPFVIFGEDIALTDWYGQDTLLGAGRYEFSLVWQAHRRIGHEYISSLQIQTQDHQTVVGNDQFITRWLYPTTIWDTDSKALDTHQLELADRLPTGAYRLSLGIYYASYPLITAESHNSPLINNRATIAWLKVPQAQLPSIPASAHPVDIVFAEQLVLSHVAFAWGDEGHLLAQLYWTSLVNRPDIDATIFVHIVNENGEIVAQSDMRPHEGQYPTFIWDAGEVVRSDHVLTFDQSLYDGAYTVRIGLYTFPGPQNLAAVADGQTIADGLVTLGTLAQYLSD